MEVELLESLYAAFNARDMEPILAKLDPTVNWPVGQTGVRVHGRESVRAYWNKQWQEIDPDIQPISVEPGADGAWVVQVHQVIKDLAGTVLADETVQHLYTFQDGLITRMEVVPGS